MNEQQKLGLERARSHAHNKEGECLSNEYKNNKAKLLWKCSDENHPPWEARFYSVIKNDTWCPKCWDKDRPLVMLDRAKAHAKSKNGECLSTEYKNSTTKMLWKCHIKEHTPWLSSYAVVATVGSWCPECWLDRLSERVTNKNGLQEAKQHAANAQILIMKNGGLPFELL